MTDFVAQEKKRAYMFYSEIYDSNAERIAEPKLSEEAFDALSKVEQEVKIKVIRSLPSYTCTQNCEEGDHNVDIIEMMPIKIGGKRICRYHYYSKRP